MEVTLTYPRNSDRPFLFMPAGCSDQEQHIRVAGFAEYVKFADRNNGSILTRSRQAKFAGGSDDNVPHLDNAVDYAEQL
ncbi:MAG: hypothetical protein ACOY9D_03985 [Pseudomonadota bacterium]